MQEIHVSIKHNLKYYEVFRLDFGARKQYDNHLAKEFFLSLNLISCTNSDSDKISFVEKHSPRILRGMFRFFQKLAVFQLACIVSCLLYRRGSCIGLDIRTSVYSSLIFLREKIHEFIDATSPTNERKTTSMFDC